MSMCVNWDPSYGMNISLAWFKGSKNLKIALFSISTVDSSTGNGNDYGNYCVNNGGGRGQMVDHDIPCGGTAQLRCTGGCIR